MMQQSLNEAPILCAARARCSLRSLVSVRRYKYKAFGTVFGTYTGAAQVNSHPEDSRSTD